MPSDNFWMFTSTRLFFGLAFDTFEFVIRGLRSFPFQVALDAVKIALGFEFSHNSSRF